MSEIEKIQRYIDRTKAKDKDRYSMNFKEMMALAHKVRDTNGTESLEAIVTAFEYGKAKGYRAAKAEVRA